MRASERSHVGLDLNLGLLSDSAMLLMERALMLGTLADRDEAIRHLTEALHEAPGDCVQLPALMMRSSRGMR